MAENDTDLKNAYNDVAPRLNETLTDTHALLTALAQLKGPEREELIKLRHHYPPQPDTAIPEDLIGSLPGQTRSLMGLASFFDTLNTPDKPLNAVEKDVAAMPWHTVAAFRGSILALYHVLKMANRTVDGDQPFTADNLAQPGKYDEAIALTGLIANRSWPVQQFVHDHQEEIFKAGQEHEKLHTMPQATLGNVSYTVMQDPAAHITK